MLQCLQLAAALCPERCWALGQTETDSESLALSCSCRHLQVPTASSPKPKPQLLALWTRAAFPGILSRSPLFASSLPPSLPHHRPSCAASLNKRQHRRLAIVGVGTSAPVQPLRFGPSIHSFLDLLARSLCALIHSFEIESPPTPDNPF